jgi:phage tail protein X
MSKCYLCVMRIGRVLSEEEHTALLKGYLVVPDLEVCKYRETTICTRKTYEANNGQKDILLTVPSGTRLQLADTSGQSVSLQLASKR